MVQHIVIRRESYVAGTKKRPEVGLFTQTHATRPPVPWNKIAVGDDVWMKWSGGPVVAKARVRGFLQIETCTPPQLREKTTGHQLHALGSYWASLPPVFFALVVWLEREEWLEEVFVPRTRSRGESWVVLNTAKAPRGLVERGSQDRCGPQGEVAHTAALGPVRRASPRRILLPLLRVATARGPAHDRPHEGLVGRPVARAGELGDGLRSLQLGQGREEPRGERGVAAA